MLKRFTIGAVLCAVFVGAIVYFNEVFMPRMIAGFFSGPMPAVTVSATRAESRDWPSYIHAIGTISAVEGVEVAPQVSGLVKQITFDPNDKVEEGQLLVQLDDAVEQADLALYEAQVRLARQTLERVTTLRDRGNASAATFDEAKATLDQAQAHLAQTKAVIGQKAIEAPFSGTVGIPRINQGQFVNAGDTLVTLQRLDRVHVDFTLPEQAIDDVRLGQTVELDVDAYPDQVFTGKITGIDPRLIETSHSLKVRATLENPDGLLLPGIFARVRVVLPERPDVVTVPQTAVTFSLYGDTVFVVEEAPADTGAPPEGAGQPAEGQPAAAAAAAAPENDQPQLIARQVFVKVGERRGDVVEILDGIKPGQRVVTAGQLKLQNGFPVVIDNSVDPAQSGLGTS